MVADHAAVPELILGNVTLVSVQVQMNVSLFCLTLFIYIYFNVIALVFHNIILA